MSELSVFRSRRVLLHDYTPSKLPHRQRELKKLKRYFKPVLNEEVNTKVHVHGKIGTGKTVLCNRLGQNLEREATEKGKKLKYVNINLAYTPKPYHVMSQLLEQVKGSSRTGLSPEETLANVAKTINKENCILVLALDEVDTYINEGRDQSIFYMFPRLHELSRAPSKLSLIYISRTLNWINKLEKATQDTLGRTAAVHLEKYGLTEIKDITSYRAQEAFLPGAVSEDIIDFIAQISLYNGGVRYALELLLEAGGHAETDYANSIKAEHVRRVHFSIPKGSSGAYYPSELSLHKQLLLKSIIDILKSRREPYLSFKDTYSSYTLVCEEYDREAEETSVIHHYLKELSSDGYIILKKEDNEAFVGMEYPFERLEGVIEKTLEKAL